MSPRARTKMLITEPEGIFIIPILSPIDGDFKGKPFG
jgi:hypothetical protein